jgi:hypothetical protein
MYKRFVYEINEGSKEGYNSYRGTDDQGNRLGIQIHRQLAVKKRKNLCIKEIMMNMTKHRIIDSKQLNVEFDLEIGKN